MDNWGFIPIILWVIGYLSIVYYEKLKIHSLSHIIVFQKQTVGINEMRWDCAALVFITNPTLAAKIPPYTTHPPSQHPQAYQPQ